MNVSKIKVTKSDTHIFHVLTDNKVLANWTWQYKKWDYIMYEWGLSET